MKKLTLILVLAFMSAAPALARPVSYPGGWMVMQNNDISANTVEMSYSPSARYAVGYTGEYWRDGKWQFHGVNLNNLLHRWNNPDSQANLYLLSGAGFAHSSSLDKDDGAAFTGIEADWEDRRFFVSYQNRGTYAGDIDQNFRQKARIGVAPYIGEFGDLHTWLMLQADHAPESRNPVTVTPLVRLFSGTNLVEAGFNNRKGVLFNFMHTF